MSYASVIDKAIEEDEEAKGEGFTESDEAYIRFRRVVEPGMVNAGFDLIPSKSSDVTQRSSGEKFTDQTLRGHILNGAAFGAQFNDTLKKIDPSSSLSQDELLKALALFACHDFHKTDEPQKRRLRNERGLGDEDKDLGEDEVRELVDTLNLDELDTSLGFRDYYASALGAEKMSGRPKQVSSKQFDILKDWVRLMDAAAGMQSPVEANSLENRAQNISDEVALHYHSVDDTRGVSTNILNHAISEYISEEEGVENLVHFHNGVIYISGRNDVLVGVPDENSLSEEELEKCLQKFMDSVKQSRNEFENPKELRGFLQDKLKKGYLEIGSTAYFLSGIGTVFATVREDILNRQSQDNWTVYSVYKDGLIAAKSWGFIHDIPPTHNKIQALGIYAATVFSELFNPLNGDNTRKSLEDLCEALEIDSVKNKLLEEYDAEDGLSLASNLSEGEINNISNGTDETHEEIKERANSINLHTGGNKSFAQVVAMCFVNETTSDGVPREELPLNELLQEMEELFLSYYRNWETHWDENRGDEWDTELTNERKTEKFELELQGVLAEASEHYIRSNVEIDGYWFAQEETKNKHNEYAKKSQGHICLLCNDLLIGDTRIKSFKSGRDSVGQSLNFTHMEKISAEDDSDPTSVVCPICDLEMTLRNSVYETNPDESSQYLVVAPDYFYSPVDIKIEKILKRELYEGGGGGLLQTSKELIGSDPSKRSDAIESVLGILRKTEEYEKFRNNLKNYDAAFDVNGSIGVYRLDPPRRQNSSNQNEPITRVPRWYLASYFAVVFSWLTSSRTLLTDTPIPTTEFDDFNEMVQIEGAPPPVQRFVGETVTISRLGDRDAWTEYEFSHLMKSDDEEQAETDNTSEGSVESGQATLTQQYADNQNEETQDDTTTKYELRINTGLAESLYRLSAFTYVGSRTKAFDNKTGNYMPQRYSSMFSDLQEPFVGANSLLKGKEQVGDYTALRAADILDTLIHQDMSNRLEELAEAGFEAAKPDSRDRDREISNHEYERLFRVARDSISDGVTKNANRDEMIDMVTGDVMKAAARARKKNARTDKDKKYAEEKYTREPAEKFARIFIDDIFVGMCDGEFYELRRLENKLASGYNAAIRRHLQEWLDEHSD